MNRQWIAKRLAMGSASYISHLTAEEKIVDCENCRRYVTGQIDVRHT